MTEIVISQPIHYFKEYTNASDNFHYGVLYTGRIKGFISVIGQSDYRVIFPGLKMYSDVPSAGSLRKMLQYLLEHKHVEEIEGIFEFKTKNEFLKWLLDAE